MAPRREYGTGSISWVTNYKARLRVRIGGRRRTRVVTVTHKDHGGRGQAQAALAEFKDELGLASGQHTLRTLMSAYVEDRERIDRKRATAESYEAVKKRLDDEIGDVDLAVLNARDLDQFYGRLKARHLKPATIGHTHAVLSAALEQGRKWGWVRTNVARDANPGTSRSQPKHRLDVGEVAKMVAHCLTPKAEGGAEDAVLGMALVLAAYTGCRRGELCGLRWDDLDGSTLRIARQWVPGKGGQRLEELKSETGAAEGSRVLPLDPRLLDALERYRTWTRDLHGEPEGWLISNDGGETPYRAKSLTENVTTLAQNLGIPATLHSLRRLTDTQLVAGGVDVDTVARRSGHTTEVMLRHYVQGADDKAIEASTILADRLIDQGLPIDALELPKAPGQTP